MHRVKTPISLSNPRTMKAVVYCRYGPPDLLEFKDIEVPALGEDSVLLRVRAAALNPLDWRLMLGKPALMRIVTGLLRPKSNTPGVDVAGVVEAVGKLVTQFKPGDEVFGTCVGACAEYAVAKELKLVKKPAGLTFEEAAAIPVAALTALQGLRDHGNLQPGQRLLINGASGGVGTFAVQIAKAFEGTVTGVCSSRNVELVRSLGADYVVDYTKIDFTQSEERYDLVLDNAASRSLSELRRVLSPGGTIVIAGAPHQMSTLGMLSFMLKPAILSRFGKQRFISFMASINQKDLLALTDLIVGGKVRPVIDRTFPLNQTAEALRYLEQGHAPGKVIITP